MFWYLLNNLICEHNTGYQCFRFVSDYNSTGKEWLDSMLRIKSPVPITFFKL